MEKVRQRETGEAFVEKVAGFNLAHLCSTVEKQGRQGHLASKTDDKKNRCRLP
jgi:hypothetical protein